MTRRHLISLICAGIAGIGVTLHAQAKPVRVLVQTELGDIVVEVDQGQVDP
jgi:hypothetical protein